MYTLTAMYSVPGVTWQQLPCEQPASCMSGCRTANNDNCVCQQMREALDRYAGLFAKLLTPQVSLWGMRWGEPYHVDFVTRSRTASYFTLLPISNRLISGTAVVPNYETCTLEPTYNTLTFRDLDLDIWAQSFMSAFDDFLALMTNGAPTAFDDPVYQRLVTLKETLAKVLATGVAPVFAMQSDGDLSAARDQFEQHVQTSFSNAYLHASIVQIPAAVSTPVPLRAESSVPRFIGTLMEFGYTHSHGNRCVLGHQAGPQFTTMSMLEVPMPRREFPHQPSLLSQRAKLSHEARVQASACTALQWSYEAQVELPAHGAQDQLWVRLAYNKPIDEPLQDCDSTDMGDHQEMFAALASFNVAWPVLWPQMQALQQEASERHTDGPAKQRVTTALLNQFEHVIQTWANWRWPTCATVPRASTAPPPADQASALYVLDFACASNGRKTLRLFAQSTQVEAGCGLSKMGWPTINGQHPCGVAFAGEVAALNNDSCWYVAQYDDQALSAMDEPSFEFVWANIDIGTYQSACSTWWIVRNANLEGSAGARTNSALVYQSPASAFSAPVVPNIILPSRQFACDGNLFTAIELALTPFANASRARPRECCLSIAMGLRSQITAPSAAALDAWCEVPILLVDNVSIANGESETIADNAHSFATLVEQLADGFMQWFNHTTPSSQSAMLKLDVTLYFNLNEVWSPIASAPELLISIPADGKMSRRGAGSHA